MNIDKDIVICIVFLLGLIIVFVKELKEHNRKQYGILGDINHKIIAVIIRHGGKMGNLEISNYLALPIEMIDSKIAEMEKKGVIHRNQTGNEIIIQTKNCNYQRKNNWVKTN